MEKITIENGISWEVSQILNPVSLNKMLVPLFLEHMGVFHSRKLKQANFILRNEVQNHRKFETLP